MWPDDVAEAQRIVDDVLHQRSRALPTGEVEVEAASRALDEAVGAARRGGDARVLASALKARGQLARDAGAWDTALDAYEEAADVSRRLAEPALLAHTLRHVADVLVDMARAADAESPLQEAMALYRALDEPPALDVANAWRSLAVLQERLGRPDAAGAAWREARSWYVRAGVPPGVQEADRRLGGGL